MTVPEAVLCDTSVVVRFVHDHRDDDQAAAQALVDAWLAEDTTIHILDLCVYEFVNVMVRRLGWSAGRASRNVQRLFDLDFPMMSCDRDLAMNVATTASATGLSGYDAAFVAAARTLAAPLVTTDGQIIESAPDIAVPLGSITAS